MDKRRGPAELGLDPGEPIVLQLGRMVPRKGVDNVIRGLGGLRETTTVAARLLVVGGGDREPDPADHPEIGRLAAIAEDEGVGRRRHVRREPRPQELVGLLQRGRRLRLDPLVRAVRHHAGRGDGLRHAGRRLGRRRDQVDASLDGETGYLVPPNDPDALADRLADLLPRPDAAVALRSSGDPRVNELFTWERVVAGSPRSTRTSSRLPPHRTGVRATAACRHDNDGPRRR